METSHSGVPLLNFQGGPGVLILNYKGSESHFSTLRGVPGAGSLKESTWILLTWLCHCHLNEDIKILCIHYQKDLSSI